VKSFTNPKVGCVTSISPTTSIVSLLYVMADGASAEIAVVGKEGIIGVALFMGGDAMPNRAIVQSVGYAYRLAGQLLKQGVNRAVALQRLLPRYPRRCSPRWRRGRRTIGIIRWNSSSVACYC
jgi:hypothetical protein